MHRLIVVILAAVDAAVAAAVGLAATLAPLTLLWVFGLGGTADWAALWPASAAVWQFGNLVPLAVTLPGEYLAVAGIDPGAAGFVLSLAPLAFAAFTAIFAARSGVRASRADAWVTGAVTGSLVFGALAALVALTAATEVAQVELWQAIVFPILLFGLPLVLGGIVTEWREAGAGFIARLRDRIEAAPRGWGESIGLIARGGAVVWAGMIGAGALLFGVALLLRGGEVIALFEAAHVDALGATVITLAQVAYLPTLVVWGLSFIAGPGFAVGAGTAVSPAGTQLGVLPGIPILGVLPESTTPWLLLLALIPVGLGALAGWIARSRLAAAHDARSMDAGDPPVESAAPAATPPWVRDDPEAGGLIGGVFDTRDPDEGAHDPVAARLVIAVGIAVMAAAGSAALAALASGALGPGRLADLGPQPGSVALAIGLETLLGAAILLLSPRRRAKQAAAEPTADTGAEAVPSAIEAETASAPVYSGVAEPDASAPDSTDTAPIDIGEPAATSDAPAGAEKAEKKRTKKRKRGTGFDGPDAAPSADLGPGRPAPLPPADPGRVD